jgi:hypothetical protein
MYPLGMGAAPILPEDGSRRHSRRVAVQLGFSAVLAGSLGLVTAWYRFRRRCVASPRASLLLRVRSATLFPSLPSDLPCTLSIPLLVLSVLSDHCTLGSFHPQMRNQLFNSLGAQLATPFGSGQ